MLTLVHHNELIMPAAQAGAFRDLLVGRRAASGGARGAVHIHPTTNFHVSAVDSGSVAQWMKANSSTMMKAIDEAVRHGAHLGLRRLRRGEAARMASLIPASTCCPSTGEFTYDTIASSGRARRRAARGDQHVLRAGRLEDRYLLRDRPVAGGASRMHDGLARLRLVLRLA